MKTFKNLYEKIYDFDNLLLAAKKAQKGKRSRANVVKFNFNLEKELFKIQEELESQTYQPIDYRTFYIYEPKKRMISAAPYRDRVVHHALCNIIQPIFENTFIEDSDANRKYKGTHPAIRRCQTFVKKNKYVLKCDIRKYFPSIDHAILKIQIRKKIACRKTLQLIDLLIDNSNPQEQNLAYFPADDLFTPLERRKGLPIGNLTSQYFANIYLNDFDHFVKEELKVKYYIRYVDDFVLFSNDKKVLHKWKDEIRQFLTRFRLSPHPYKTHITPTDLGVDFLGQRVYANHRKLKGGNVRRFKYKLNQKIKLFRKNKIDVSHFEASINSWFGHALQADTFRLRHKIAFAIQDKGLRLVKTERSSWRLLEQQH